VLASGSGTTVEAFIRAGQRGDIDTDVGLVICSREDAGIFDRIKSLNNEFGLDTQTKLINSKTHPAATGETPGKGEQTAAEESAIIELLKNGNFQLVVQMGYMKKSGKHLVHEFGWRPEYTSVYQARMLNTHPGLLPESQGLYGELVQRHVIEKQLPFSGQTLHIVAEEYDDGPVIAEHPVKVQIGDTPESLFARVQAMEKQKLPLDIQHFITGQEAYNKQHQ
jgi:phosphoribosylglycinamide formyltransferase 1